MPLGTLDRRAPSFMRQGPSAVSQLVLYSALALFLMVADARFRVTDPLRKGIAAVLYPAQWAMVKPVEWAEEAAGYFQSLKAAQSESDLARKQLALQSQRAHQADQLAHENERLRQLLGLRARLQGASQAAQILYETTDPYSRRVMVDRGQDAGVQAGSPVLDGAGVLGQVTRVYPFVSEVTLLIDRDQAIPVVNMRTNARGVAYGDPVASHGGGMELRFVSANADVQENDLLTTSGLDGVYPSGLPVARVVRVERRADSAFARIYCAPIAAIQGAHHVLLLEPVAGGVAQRPEPAPDDGAGRKKGRK